MDKYDKCEAANSIEICLEDSGRNIEEGKAHLERLCILAGRCDYKEEYKGKMYCTYEQRYGTMRDRW